MRSNSVSLTVRRFQCSGLMNSYLIASVKLIMSDLFRSWPIEGLYVYPSGLSQQKMRDVRRRIMAFTCPERAAYQLCLAKASAEAQMLNMIAES